MQPFPNPNYYNTYAQPQIPTVPPVPQVQPVLDRLSQYQQAVQQYAQMQAQPMQRQMLPGINGRVVNDFNEIIPDDVPTNGTYAFFVKNDMSEIQARTWEADGKIICVAFKPVLDSKANNSQNETQKAVLGLSDEATGAFMQRFDDIANRLDNLEEIFSKQSSRAQRKKEADAE